MQPETSSAAGSSVSAAPAYHVVVQLDATDRPSVRTYPTVDAMVEELRKLHTAHVHGHAAPFVAAFVGSRALFTDGLLPVMSVDGVEHRLYDIEALTGSYSADGMLGGAKAVADFEVPGPYTTSDEVFEEEEGDDDSFV